MSSVMSYCASAPGSLMLFGEHAVLHGSAAIATAVSSRITVTVTSRQDQRVIIRSDSFPSYEGTLSDLVPTEPHHFVLAAIASCALNTGCELQIVSDFPATVGLGSSAAVTVATLAALHAWLQQPLSHAELAQRARQIIREQQGVGSGTDVVASVYGGVVCYQPEPWHVEPLPLLPAITLYYSGYKTKTADVIAQIAQKQAEEPQLYECLYDLITFCVESAKDALQIQDWAMVGEIMTLHHEAQVALGTSDETLDTIIHKMKQQPHILGAKISGSGLGDCVVGLGHVTDDLNVEQIFVQCSAQGVLLHEN